MIIFISISFNMYIDIVIKELDELEKKKDYIPSNIYLNECNKLKEKYELYKKMDNDNIYIINLIKNNFIDNDNNYNNNNNDNDNDNNNNNYNYNLKKNK
jgi:hypothetical protein